MQKMKLLNFHIDESTLALLADCARQSDTDKSKIIRKSIRSYLTWFFTESSISDKGISERDLIESMTEPLTPMFS